MKGGLHVCIATGQNLANLIPALQCEAAEVWVLQSPAMRASGAHLAAALKARRIAVQRIDFVDDDVTMLHEQTATLAERLDGRVVTINLTGGTKLMTLALVQTLAAHLQTAAAALAPALVYTDTGHRRLDWLSPVPRSEPMLSVLRIDDILLAQGYRRQGGSGGAEAAHWQRRAQDRSGVTRYIGDNARSLGRFLGALNGLAKRALNEPGGPWCPLQRLDFAPGGAPARLLNEARKASLASWDNDTGICFHDPDAARYLGGGWVEEYAGLKISGSRLDNWAPRLLIEQVDTRTRNELDAVAVHRNRMLLVECKAARTDAGNMADWIYKASQLARQVGGLLTQPLILSARDASEEHRNRAREYGVALLAGHELAGLSDWLRRWMDA